MKRQDLVKHHQMSIPELKVAVTKLEKDLVESQLKIRIGQEKNLHLAKSITQDIARLKTIIRHKELTANTQPKSDPTAKKTTKSISSKKKDTK